MVKLRHYGVTAVHTMVRRSGKEYSHLSPWYQARDIHTEPLVFTPRPWLNQRDSIVIDMTGLN